MNYKGHYISNFNFKGNSYELIVVELKDYRKFYELDTMLKTVTCNDVGKIKHIKKSIPKAYVKSFDINGKKIKFIDRLAMPYIIKEIDDYDLRRYFDNAEVKILKEYPIECLCSILNKLAPKCNSINQLSEKIKSIDSVQQDLLHTMENQDLSDKEMLEVAYELKMLREHRRIEKNEYAIMYTLKRFFDNHKLKQGDITKFTNEINKHKFNLGNKIYNNRATNEELDYWKIKLQQYTCG